MPDILLQYIYIQNNNTFVLPERIPFNDVTEKMKSFFNTKKNQPFNTFSMNFNDISNETKNIQFLKKKSHGDIMNTFKEDEEKEELKESLSKSSKYLNNLFKKNINTTSNVNNLDEDNEESDKENLGIINNNININEDEIDVSQILNDTIKEKKENDKFERERKKAPPLTGPSSSGGTVDTFSGTSPSTVAPTSTWAPIRC